MYGFWGGILLLGIVHRLISYLIERQQQPRSGDVETHTWSHKTQSGPILSAFAAGRHWLRANFIVPATFGTHHRQLAWACSIPTRLETIVVTAYCVLSAILCAVSYEVFEHNL